ncbi:hypothetical protein CGI92_23765 [Vibrio parahaemolyticus]|nr:hypothetical protein CGI92_23765 [Vibrio parahaemolyticus]
MLLQVFYVKLNQFCPKSLIGLKNVMNKILKVKIVGLLFASLLLTGCMDDKNDSSFKNDDYSKIITSSVMDSYDLVEKDKDHSQYYVDLSRNVKLSSSSGFTITDFKTMSSNKLCRPISIDSKGFIIARNESIICDYKYSVSLTNKLDELIGDNEGWSRVLVSKNAKSAELRPFGMVGVEAQLLHIDLAKELLEVGDHTDLKNFVLDDTVEVRPSGTALTIANKADNSIDFIPNYGTTGSTVTVLYSLTNTITGEILAGSFIVTIGDTNTIGIDIDDKITVNQTSSGDDIEPGKWAKNIDLSPYVNLPNFQLIYVQVFNADAVVSAYPIISKSFDFYADKSGDYYVNAVVTDNKGSYDVALIQVNVKAIHSGGGWHDLKDKLNYFYKPLTTSEMTSVGMSATSSNFDDIVIGDDGTSGRWVASFSQSDAIAYCGRIGGNLPTETQFLSLANYPPVTPKIDGWPLELKYWTDTGKVADLKDGVSTSSSFGMAYYVTCVKSGSLKIVSSNILAKDIPADGSSEAKVVAELTFGGNPVNGEYLSGEIAAATPTTTASFNPLGQTNANGQAEFFITDIKAENLIFTVKYNEESVSMPVNFVADVTTANLTQKTTIDNAVLPTGSDKIEVELVDAFTNAIANAKVTFGSLPTGFIYDGGVGGKAEINTNPDGKGSISVKWNPLNPIPTSDQSFSVHSSYSDIPSSTSVSASSYVNFKVTKLSELYIDDGTATKPTSITIPYTDTATVKGILDSTTAGIAVTYTASSNLSGYSCLFDGKTVPPGGQRVQSNSSGETSIDVSLDTAGSPPSKDVKCTINADVGSSNMAVDITFEAGGSPMLDICGTEYNNAPKGGTNADCITVISPDQWATSDKAPTFPLLALNIPAKFAVKYNIAYPYAISAVKAGHGTVDGAINCGSNPSPECGSPMTSELTANIYCYVGTRAGDGVLHGTDLDNYTYAFCISNEGTMVTNNTSSDAFIGPRSICKALSKDGVGKRTNWRAPISRSELSPWKDYIGGSSNTGGHDFNWLRVPNLPWLIQDGSNIGYLYAPKDVPPSTHYNRGWTYSAMGGGKESYLQYPPLCISDIP